MKEFMMGVADVVLVLCGIGLSVLVCKTLLELIPVEYWHGRRKGSTAQLRRAQRACVLRQLEEDAQHAKTELEHLVLLKAACNKLKHIDDANDFFERAED